MRPNKLWIRSLLDPAEASDSSRPNRLNHIDFIPMSPNYAELFGETDVRYLDASEKLKKVPNWSNLFYLPDGHMSVAGDQFRADYIHRQMFKNRTQ
jgi:hypothetical protein